jgi:hypothetical protein
MATSSRIIVTAGHRAVNAAYELFGRVRLLLGPSPHFPDAFSPDDLPIAFILRRGSPRNIGRRRSRDDKMHLVRSLHSRPKSRAGERRRPDARSILRPGHYDASRPTRCHLVRSRHSIRRAPYQVHLRALGREGLRRSNAGEGVVGSCD